MNDIKLEHLEGLEFLSKIPDNSVDLILTDPPYVISKDTGMDKFAKKVEQFKKQGVAAKTDQEFEEYRDNTDWHQFFRKKKIPISDWCPKLVEYRAGYLEYGSIYGKKYAVKTQFGDWDINFTMEQLESFIGEFYRVLKDGGTCIVFFDVWKITPLKVMMESSKFKGIRLVEWLKTNPLPINQSVNYLSNCREVALLGVKKGKPTFNSKYDNGVYVLPLASSKDKIHSTQKSVRLFDNLIEKHSNEGDVVLDSFAGSATTAISCINTNRKFIGCEVDEDYYNKATERIKNVTNNKKIGV